MSQIISNIYEIEAPMLERLKQTLGRPWIVESSPDGAAGFIASHYAQLLFGGTSSIDATEDGGATEITQIWTVLIMIRNATDIRSGAAARTEAGTVAATIYRAFAGWQPSANWSGLIPVQSPTPPSYDAGDIIEPVSFETTAVLFSSAACADGN